MTEAAGKRLGEDGVRDVVRGARAAEGGMEAQEGLAEIGQTLATGGGSGRTRRRRSGRARPSGSGWG